MICHDLSRIRPNCDGFHGRDSQWPPSEIERCFAPQGLRGVDCRRRPCDTRVCHTCGVEPYLARNRLFSSICCGRFGFPSPWGRQVFQHIYIAEGVCVIQTPCLVMCSLCRDVAALPLRGCLFNLANLGNARPGRHRSGGGGAACFSKEPHNERRDGLAVQRPSG